MSDCIAWALTEITPEQVEQRRANARRNGYATWLWPEVDVAHWRTALEEIVSVTRRVLAGESVPELVVDDACAMGIAAYSSGMGPLLGFWVENGTVRAPRETGDLLRLHLSHNRRRMTRLSFDLKDTIELLNRGNIIPVVLKGMDTSLRYFPEPGVRPMSDIDVFVPVESIPQAEQIFSRLGYRRVPRARAPYACDWVSPRVSQLPRTLTMVHEADPWSIDVLGSLDKRLPTGARIRFDALLSRTSLADWPAAGRAQVMSQPLLALYLAVHFCQTLLNATVLRALELVLVIRRDSALGTLDWNDFLRDANILGGLRFVYPALVFVERLAPGTVPASVMEAATRDASENLQNIVMNLTLATAQPLDRHSIRERFMWASNWRECVFQIASELSVDGRGTPLKAAAYSIGTKLWALRRRRYST
ncbi:MAG TPA: nucleotidyltransferase family protein [Rhizomicrobium sp.]|jgi:hypothetical protein|nr:nucleotidyltransferase family protein [Rhizomicrobium sp.]